MIALLLAVLVGPALVVLALEGGGDDGAGATPMRIARLPTDVAVLGDTVWVASGRDDRVVALEGGPRGSRRAASDRFGAAAGRGRRGLGVDSERRRRQRDALNPRPWLARAADRDRRRRHRRGGRRGRGLGVQRPGGNRDADRPVSNRRLGPPIRTGNFPTALALGANYLWVVDSGDGTVARVDPREDLVVGRRHRSAATRRTSRSASARSGSPTAATAR